MIKHRSLEQDSQNYFSAICISLFSNTLNLCSSLRMRNQVSDPYKRTAKIILLYIAIFKSLGRRCETKVSEQNGSKNSLTFIYFKYFQ